MREFGGRAESANFIEQASRYLFFTGKGGVGGNPFVALAADSLPASVGVKSSFASS